jgi:hypothetical protein
VFRTYAFKIRFRFNLIFNLILVLSWFSPTAVQAVAFRDVGTLPPKEFYTEATTTPHSIGIVYSLHSTSSEYQMPISSINGGDALLFKIEIPPGTTYASLNAESNFWQGSLMNVFDEEPTEFCGDNNSCQGIHTSDLKNATGGFSAALYGDLKQKDFPVLADPTYKYFVLYQRPGYGIFVFSSLTFRFQITDIGTYELWRIGVPQYALKVTANNGTVTINPPNVQCDNATDATCNQTYPADTQVTLTATAQEGFRFVNWGNGCGGTNSVTSFIMNSNKTCSATFEKIPENPPEIELLDSAAKPLSEDSSIQFGSTEEGKPVTKTFTIKNTGTGDLNINTVTPPDGFSLVENNLFPLTIQPNTSTKITIQLDAEEPDSYSGNLRIDNNDADKNPFNLVITGTVEEFDQFNLNQGLVIGKEFSEHVKIVVTANVENVAGIFEPVTQDNKETNLKITADSSVDINAIITPAHSFIEMVVVASWDNQGTIHWYQKTKTPNISCDETNSWCEEIGWENFDLNMSKPYAKPYGIYTGKESYLVNVFTGQLVPPAGLEQAQQVHFYVGYGIPQSGRYIYIVSQPLTFQLQ